MWAGSDIEDIAAPYVIDIWEETIAVVEDSESQSERSSDSGTDETSVDSNHAKWPPLTVLHSDTSAAAYLAGEGLAQGPHAPTTAQVASAARVCTRLLELWRRPQGAGGASFCRRALLQEAIRGAAEETGNTQRCSEWLTPRELELCNGVMRRCGGASGGSDTPSTTETHCSTPGNCALHGVAVLSRDGVDLALLNELSRITVAGDGTDGDETSESDDVLSDSTYCTDGGTSESDTCMTSEGWSEDSTEDDGEASEERWTALHAACRLHSPSLVLFLLAMGADPNVAEGGKHPWFPLRLLLARRDLVAAGVLPQCLMSPDGTHLHGTDGDRLMVAMVGVFADIFGFAGLRAVSDALAVPPALIAQVPWTLQKHLRAQSKPVSRVAPRGERAVARWHPLAYCCGPTFASLHAMGACYARGMRPSRGGLIAIVSAPLERAHSNRTMSNEDGGFVAALSEMGIAMRLCEATAGLSSKVNTIEDGSQRTREKSNCCQRALVVANSDTAQSTCIAVGCTNGERDESTLCLDEDTSSRFVVDDDLLYSIVRCAVSEVIEGVVGVQYTAEAFRALFSLPRLAQESRSRNSQALFEALEGLCVHVFTDTSVPHTLAVIDALWCDTRRFCCALPRRQTSEKCGKVQ